MAGVFLKRDFYLSIFFARRMKKNKHEFLACARHARLPLQIWFFAFTTFTISPQNRGWVFLRPHFFLGNIFRRFFAQNHRLCEGCESEKIKIPVMRARYAREGLCKTISLRSIFGAFPLVRKNLPRSKKISESFPKNSNVFQKISNVFQRISDVFGISPTYNSNQTTSVRSLTTLGQ